MCHSWIRDSQIFCYSKQKWHLYVSTDTETIHSKHFKIFKRQENLKIKIDLQMLLCKT